MELLSYLFFTVGGFLIALLVIRCRAVPAKIKTKAAGDGLQIVKGLQMIADERLRQISEKGYSSARDDKYEDAELSNAAFEYCFMAALQTHKWGVTPEEWTAGWKDGKPSNWPWASDSWKPSNNPVRNLVKAGALIAAEIDRLERRKELTDYAAVPASHEA